MNKIGEQTYNKRKYCSVRCRTYVLRRHVEPRERHCAREKCGVQFISSEHAPRRQRYCSRRCSVAEYWRRRRIRERKLRERKFVKKAA